VVLPSDDPEVRSQAPRPRHAFLGIEVRQHPDGIEITQEAYIRRTLEEFDMTEVRDSYAPASLGAVQAAIKLDGNQAPVDQTTFRHVLGKIMYPAIGTRPDISYVVAFLSRYAHAPTAHHMNMAKTLLRYLAHTSHYSLFYPATAGRFDLVAYSDADWAGAHDSRSTSGVLTLVNGTALTWLSRKQPLVAMSTAEAEYIAAAECALEVTWLRRLAVDLGHEQHAPTPLLLDNRSCILLATNPSNHSRTKHIDYRYHKLRELVEDETLAPRYVPSADQLADVFTKPLAAEALARIADRIGMQRSLPSP
jgi:hypothetical protein